jgi:ribosomal protein S7
MTNGNKETCENIFLKSSKLLQKSLLKNNQEVIKIGIINSSPVVNLKEIRLQKGKKKTVKKYPFVLDFDTRIALAIKLILKTVKQNEKKSFYLYTNLKEEIEANSKNKSSAVKRKEDLQKDALLNKKYTYYRWF